MNTIKRTILVTIEKEIEIELPANLGSEESLAEWRKGLWHVDSIDDIFKYAARMAAYYGGGREHDGLGLLDWHYSTYPRVPDVKFKELSDECEEEFIGIATNVTQKASA